MTSFLQRSKWHGKSKPEIFYEIESPVLSSPDSSDLQNTCQSLVNCLPCLFHVSHLITKILIFLRLCVCFCVHACTNVQKLEALDPLKVGLEAVANLQE